jgi:hypothetical protein
MVYRETENYSVIQQLLLKAFVRRLEVQVKAEMDYTGCLNPITRALVRPQGEATRNGFGTLGTL